MGERVFITNDSFAMNRLISILPPSQLPKQFNLGGIHFLRSTAIPEELQAQIRQMVRENPLWGEERIANELFLKLGILVSPRTVRKYMPKERSRGPRGDQRWSTFLRNHAGAILACDFFVVVTITFRILYVFVLLEHGSRRIMHVGVTAHPTAAWTLQQLRNAIL